MEGGRYVYESRIRDGYSLIILTAESSFFRVVEENLMEGAIFSNWERIKKLIRNCDESPQILAIKKQFSH